MSGHIYYRFKSQKEPLRITFDGVGISVFDLKREIILSSKMGKGSDFDFAIYSADTDEEYKNDHAVIPRASSVIARRLPPKKSGHGNAQFYAADAAGPSRNAAALAPHADWRGGGAITKDFRQKDNTPKIEAAGITKSGGDRDAEAESMAAVFAQQEQQWQQTQEVMATATRVGRQTLKERQPRPGGATDRPPKKDNSQVPQSAPPQGYICYRCGQKGHWIQECPTNDNPEFQGRPRIKRTTGIPKSFLQKVEGKPEDGQNVMVTADGSFVIARPDDASWQQHKAVVVKNLSAADILNLQPSDPDLACSICTTLLKEAVKTPCCQSSFCKDCIISHLQEHSGLCPECESKVASGVNGLLPDEDRRVRSKDYLEDLLRASRVAGDEDKIGSETGDQTDDVAAYENPDEENAEKIASDVGDDVATANSTEPPNNVETLSTGDVNDVPTKESSSVAEKDKSPSVANDPTTTAPSFQPDSGEHNIMGNHMMFNGPPQHGMMNGNGGMPSVPNFNPQMMNPHMIQAQMMQCTMMLQNPQLSPPMRMQLVAQQQQLQMMWMNLMANNNPTHFSPPPMLPPPPHMNSPPMLQPQHGLNGSTPQPQMNSTAFQGTARGAFNGAGGRGGRFNLSAFQHRLQQQQQVQSQPQPQQFSNPLQQQQQQSQQQPQPQQIQVVAPVPPVTEEGPYERVPINGRRALATKRARTEDLVELANGEKVPRYM